MLRAIGWFVTAGIVLSLFGEQAAAGLNAMRALPDWASGALLTLYLLVAISGALSATVVPLLILVASRRLTGPRRLLMLAPLAWFGAFYWTVAADRLRLAEIDRTNEAAVASLPPLDLRETDILVASGREVEGFWAVEIAGAMGAKATYVMDASGGRAVSSHHLLPEEACEGEEDDPRLGVSWSRVYRDGRDEACVLSVREGANLPVPQPTAAKRVLVKVDEGHLLSPDIQGPMWRFVVTYPDGQSRTLTSGWAAMLPPIPITGSGTLFARDDYFLSAGVGSWMARGVHLERDIRALLGHGMNAGAAGPSPEALGLHGAVTVLQGTAIEGHPR